jgi:transcriptional antiterminator RfaH
VTSITDARWYVVQTHANSEHKAASHLARQNFDIYLPRYLKRRRHARRTETVAAPLFPRYMFVLVDTQTQRWRSIQSTLGVTRLVCHGDRPAPVPANVVEALRRREDAGGLITLDERPRFSIGDQVQILDGAFSMHLGLYEGISDNKRVTVLLNLLGRKVRVNLDLDLVAAI